MGLGTKRYVSEPFLAICADPYAHLIATVLSLIYHDYG